MSDQGTRTRPSTFGTDDRDDPSEKDVIRVRMGSGKIYGPYTRAEIIQFIYQKKLKGEELILVGSSTQWKALSSDTEFFDALQNALAGKKLEPKKKKKEKTHIVANDDSDQSTKLSSQQKASENSPRTRLTEILMPPENEEKGPTEEIREELPGPLRLINEKGHDSQPTKEPLKISSRIDPPPSMDLNVGASKTKTFNSKIMLVLVLIGAVLVVMFLLPKSKEGYETSLATESSWGFQTDKKYLQSLHQNLSKLKTETVSFPEWQNLSNSINSEHLGGWGAANWSEQLEKLDKLAQSNPLIKNAATFWESKAWNLRWLASVMQVMDSKKAVGVAVYADKIIEELQQRGKMSPSSVLTFRMQKLFIDGQLKEILAIPDLQGSEAAQWLVDEAAWLMFWDGDPTVDRSRFKNAARMRDVQLTVIGKIKEGLFGNSKDVPALVMQLATLDPNQYHLWFSFAQYNWRIDSVGVERANRLFQTGLSVLSLYPRVVQQIYWKQYGEFLLKFGREALVKNVKNNLQILASSGLGEKGISWWDLGSPELDINYLLEATLVRLKSAKFDFIDLATAHVLGALSSQGVEVLNLAALHWIFEKEWERAEREFQSSLSIDPNSADALGGLVWVYSSQYSFDKAFTTLDKLVKSSSGQESRKKYQAVIHWLGREPQEAKSLLNEYIREFPNDSLAHYLLAKVNEGLEKNNECAKAANLARIHGAGELKFRSNLLFFRCTILGKIAVRKSLEELDALHQSDPQNIPIILERVDGYMNANLGSDALEIAREAVENFPWSYPLRLKLGDVYLFRSEYDRAVAFYNDAAVYKKNSAEAFVKLSFVLDKQKKYLEAARNLSVASKIDPAYPDVYLLAGRAFDKAGRPEEAVDYYVNEVKERPAALGSFLEVAEFLLKNNAPQELPKVFSFLSPEFREDPRVQTRLAQAYLALSDYEKARISASSAIAADPKIPEPHQIMGYVYEQLGQYDMARSSFERYLLLFGAAPDASAIRAKLSQHPYE